MLQVRGLAESGVVMRLIIRRCNHCGAKYTYQASGRPAGKYRGDGEYCGDCKDVIDITLRSIPKRVEKVWVETDEVSGADLLEEQERQARRCMAGGRVFGTPVLAGTYRLEGNKVVDYQDGTMVKHNGKEYEVRWWESQPDDFKVRVTTAKNVKTGEIEGLW